MQKKICLILVLACVLIAEQVSAGVSTGWLKHVIAKQNTPIYLDIKDMDNDGDLDIASTTNRHPNLYNSEIAWFQNNLNIKKPWKKIIISSREPGTNPVTNANGIVIADLDGDGRDDVAIASGMAAATKGNIIWFKAPKDPTGKWQRFNIELNIENSYFKISVIDANKDGKLDLVAGGTRGAVLFINPGESAKAGTSWKKIAFPENDGRTGSSVYAGDINGDDRTDIINSCEGDDKSGNISWFDITYKGKKIIFNRTMIDPDLPMAFDNNCMDINGDSRKDILVTIFKDSHIFWFEAPAKQGGPWVKHMITDSLKGTDIYTGDIDGDGKKDFVVSGLFQKKVSWFKYNKAKQEWTQNVIDNNIKFPGDITLKDLDGDGDLDVVIAGMGVNQMLWYENRIKH